MSGSVIRTVDADEARSAFPGLFPAEHERGLNSSGEPLRVIYIRNNILAGDPTRDHIIIVSNGDAVIDSLFMMPLESDGMPEVLALTRKPRGRLARITVAIARWLLRRIEVV